MNLSLNDDPDRLPKYILLVLQIAIGCGVGDSAQQTATPGTHTPSATLVSPFQPSSTPASTSIATTPEAVMATTPSPSEQTDSLDSTFAPTFTVRNHESTPTQQLPSDTISNTQTEAEPTVTSLELVPDSPRRNRIAAGHYHSLFIDPSGLLWSWGYSDVGALGHGEADLLEVPAAVELPTKAVSVACGFEWSLVLDQNGDVWAFGSNNKGQIGRSGDDVKVPVKIEGLPRIIGIAAGGDHALALDTNGSLWSWGNNEAGQLGRGDSTIETTVEPGQVVDIGRVKELDAGSFTSIAISNDGQVWVWGYGVQGQGPTQEYTNFFSPESVEEMKPAWDVTVGHQQSMSALEDGVVWAWGRLSFQQEDDRQPPTMRVIDAEVHSVDSGWLTHFAIDTDGGLWGWGDNQSAQVGVGYASYEVLEPTKVLSNVLEVEMGRTHGLAIDLDGQLWGWGNHGGFMLATVQSSDDVVSSPTLLTSWW